MFAQILTINTLKLIQMDQLTPFQVFLLERLDFSPNSYEIYQGGKLIKNGATSMEIKVRAIEKNSIAQDNLRVSIENNNLSDILDSTASFDMVMTLHDRYIAVVLPEQTNINDIMFTTFPMVVKYTRFEKFFKDKEPLCMSMFTENGNVVKMSFKVYSPETLIELSI